jgi:hypothetical protein
MKRKKTKSPVASVHIVKPLAWVDTYLARAKRKMPAMILPKQILSYRPRLGAKHRTWGSCSVRERLITLATHRQDTVEKKTKGNKGKAKKEKVLIALTHREILMTLAHELAHLEYPEHGYEQKWYALTIFNTFGLYDTCPHCDGKGKIAARYEND